MSAPTEDTPIILKIIRVLTAGATVGLAYLSFTAAAANVTARTTPDTALRLEPGNCVATTTKANTLIVQKLQGKLQHGAETRIEQLALDALRHCPLRVAAVRTLGIIRADRNRKDNALALMQIADRQSRRDLLAQVWLVDHWALLDQPGQALKHYDNLLRSGKPVQPLIYPRLATALKRPPIRREFLPYVTGNTPWLAHFLSETLLTAEGPALVADLLEDAGGTPRSSLLDALKPEIARRLIEVGETGRAARFYRREFPSHEAVLNTLAFNDENRDSSGYGLFAWQIEDLPGLYLGFGSGNTASEAYFQVDIEQTNGGSVLSKTMLLPEGVHTIAAPAFDNSEWFEWRVVCLSGGSETRIAPGQTGRILVGPTCPAQKIRLWTRSVPNNVQLYGIKVPAPKFVKA